MKDEITGLLQKVGQMMQRELAAQNFDAATALSPLLSRLKDLQKRSDLVRSELAEIQSALSHTNGKPNAQHVVELLPRLGAMDDYEEVGRSRPQTLRLKIDWQANRRSHDDEEICEHTAAATMTTFINRIIQEFGEQAIKKLEAIRVNRGPLISKTPAADFVNQAQGRLYGHKKIRGTDYYLLTHSSTSQKVEDIRRVCRVLGFVPGSVQIEQLDRENMYV